MLMDLLSPSAAPLLLLAGEPGIGKSRLLAEASRSARGAGWAVMQGGIVTSLGHAPYAPIVDAVASHLAGCTAAQTRHSLRGTSWLTRLLPELAEAGVLAPPRWALAPDQERSLMSAAVARFLINIAGPSGTLLILDDLQWAGTEAIELIGTLAARAGNGSGPPLRLLGACRSTEVVAGHPLAHLFSDLARDGLAIELQLGPLSPDASRDLVMDVLGGVPEGERWSERLYERTGGNPFALMSFAQAAVALMNDAEQIDVSALDVPRDVAQSIGHRLGRLPEAAGNLVRATAVAGRSVGQATVEDVAAWLGLETGVATAAMEAAHQARLLVEDGQDGYRFAHDLIYEVAAAELGTWRRRDAHCVIAESLERHLSQHDRDARASELAHHFAAGGQPIRAVPYALSAGKQAEAMYAFAEAAERYRMAVDLAEAGDDRAQMANAHAQLGKLLLWTYLIDTPPEAIEHLGRAASLYREIGDLDAWALMSAVLAEAQVSAGHSGDGLRLLEGIRRLEQVSAQSAERTSAETAPSASVLSADTKARVALSESAILHFLGRADESLPPSREALAYAATTADHQLRFDAHERYWRARITLDGPTDEAMAGFEGAIPLAERARNLGNLLMALGNCGDSRWQRGDLADCRRHYARALELAEPSKDGLNAVTVGNNLGELAFIEGDWPAARRQFEQAIAQSRPNSVDAVLFSGHLDVIGLVQGDKAAARRLEAYARAGSIDYEVEIWPRWALAERELLRGHPSAAAEYAQPLLERYDGQSVLVGLLRALAAWAALECGDADRAEELAERAVARATAQHFRLALVDALRVRALVATHCGHWDAAAEDLDEAIVLAQSIPYPYAEAKALYVRGLMFSTTGQYEQARTSLREADTILRRLGERLYHEFVDLALERMHGEA